MVSGDVCGCQADREWTVVALQCVFMNLYISEVNASHGSVMVELTSSFLPYLGTLYSIFLFIHCSKAKYLLWTHPKHYEFGGLVCFLKYNIH